MTIKKATFTITLLFTLAALAPFPASGQTEKKPDPLQRVYTAAPDAAFLIMGRAIASNWVIKHTDKDLCLVAFEKKTSLVSSGGDATATCEPAEGGGTLVRIKVRQKGNVSLGSKERGFAKDVFEEIEKAGLK